MPGSGKQLRKILYVGMRYDYGRREQGFSFEYTNFYRVLIRMVPSVVEFDFMTRFQELGRERMNQLLLATAEQESPDLIFFILFTDEILPDTIRRLTGRWLTFNWFCDDHWRFSNYSKYYAPNFSFVSTTDIDALPKYEKIGYHHALYTQWACNHFDYVKLPDAQRVHDVTFVGQPHGNRKRTIQFLQNNGVNVQAYGRGWSLGRISQEAMVRLFNESRINLNLSNTSLNIHTLFRNQQQLKGRNFEIPGCGGFVLTNYVNGLERYFTIGEEVACFMNRRDMLNQIWYYLSHVDKREAIAIRGYERTLRDHTYEKRFTELFTQMGFSL